MVHLDAYFHPITRSTLTGDLFTIRCPLLAIPTAIIYAIQEAEGTGGRIFPRVVGCAILLLAFVVASRRVLPLAMQRLVLKDKKKVQDTTYSTAPFLWHIFVGAFVDAPRPSYCKSLVYSAVSFEDDMFESV